MRQGKKVRTVSAAKKLSTTDHLEIRRWAESREAAPTTEVPDRLGFDFPDYSDELDPMPWDRWFAEFEARGLEFVYREAESDRLSNFFLLRPRENG
jgi:hypothetical protein